MGVEHFKDYGVHWYSILIVIAWTVIFMLMSLKLLKKRDL
jgi:prolipoprotein diacylglyceryltransferase